MHKKGMPNICLYSDRKLLKLCHFILAKVDNGSIVTITGHDGKFVRKWRVEILEMMRINDEALPEDNKMMGGPNWADGEDAVVEIDECRR
jgi:hypothetical protein